MTTIPADLKVALTEAGLADFFAECTASHQREYLKWVSEAKRPETRKNRIAQAIEMISDKLAKETAKVGL
ncbi:MAG: YdeI/OmpD-associated family protein [Nibricoccus sp.]